MSSTEKSISSSLQHIEKHLADKNPALLQAFRLYHELDQVAFELDLIGLDESLASKTSWSPIITLIGDNTSGKQEFINRYIKPTTPISYNVDNHSQFNVITHREDSLSMVLPGTAVDGDPRFPFFHISERLEQIHKGESRHINLYLELQTNNSPVLKDKTLINAPGFNEHEKQSGINLLRNHACDLSDLVFVFFNADQLDNLAHRNLSAFFDYAAESQSPNKFIYIISQAENNQTAINLDEWKTYLKRLGLQSGQFFILSADIESSEQKQIEQKLANIDIDSAYRILNMLEQHIHDVEDVAIYEVKNAIAIWKERTHFTLVALLSVISLTIVAGEIQFGLLAILLDPFVASIFLFLLTIGLIPFHWYSSTVHAKFIITMLQERQMKLGLMENLPALFAKNLTLWRIFLPLKEPMGWTKETKETLDMILTRAKSLVQSLNNSFNASSSTNNSQPQDTFLNL